MFLRQIQDNFGYLNPVTGDVNRKGRTFYKSEKGPQFAENYDINFLKLTNKPWAT